MEKNLQRPSSSANVSSQHNNGNIHDYSRRAFNDLQKNFEGGSRNDAFGINKKVEKSGEDINGKVNEFIMGG